MKAQLLQEAKSATSPGRAGKQLPSIGRKCACGKQITSGGSGPAIVPAIVYEVLRDEGEPIPFAVRHDMETRLGHNFANVRLHTDERAGASAQAVAAHAFTVGRHIAFAPGRFDPGSAPGRKLLAHELTHAAGHPENAPTPSGNLRINAPNEAAERHAVAVSEGLVAPTLTSFTSPGLSRQGAAVVPLTGVTVNQDRVTVPPIASLAFSAAKTPAKASGVKFSLVGDNAKIAAGTKIDDTTGVITVAADQTGGLAHVEAKQTATEPDGSTTETIQQAPFNFAAIPLGIASTKKEDLSGASGRYGGLFTHTFKSPAGGQTALDRSHVNEQFQGASGTTLTITGLLDTLTITVNNPDSANAGWDLDSSGTMAAPDSVTWSNSVDARPFVSNASNKSPKGALPQELTAVQNFRNLTFPTRKYADTAASTTHRRAFEERSGKFKAVTSANATGINAEVIEDYVGPTVFRKCKADPATIPIAPSAPPGGSAPAAQTSKITVDMQGQYAMTQFSILKPDLDCKITSSGVLTPGSKPGTITVQAGDSTNFDQTTVTIAPQPAKSTPSPGPNPIPAPRP
jgi:Domain of unknown function (DUF4157)